MPPRTLRFVGLVLAYLLTIAQPLHAQWASIGDVSAPTRDGHTLTFRSRQATVAVSVVAPEIVRVRFVPADRLGRDHSYAVVTRDFGDPGVTMAVESGRSTITTRALAVRIQHRPFRLSIADSAGNSLDEDDPAMGMASSGTVTRAWKRLRDDEQIYGFGEKAGRLNRRGKFLGGHVFGMWNTDAGGYDMGTDPLYASFPFFIVLRNGRAHGLFLDNTFRTSFDIGKEIRGRLSFGAEDGGLDYYFIDGPHPKQVIARYSQLTGRMPLPPLWSLGFHQCRYSYYPESRVRFIAANFRERKIPLDVLWLDIHHLDGYNPLTWDRTRFPDPAGLIRDLRGQGIRMVTIVDPHPKKQPGWDVYDSGLAGDHFVKNPDGSVFEAPVWPSNAERNPGPSVFPDYSKPAARDWWGGLYKRLTDVGVAGIWNDMNEPAIFVAPTWTFPLDVRHDNEGQPTDHRGIHNVYGLLMTRSTFEGLSTLRPSERPFILTRATFSGGQRYAALWPGDNLSRWEDLRHSLPMLASLGLAGMPFVGSDIGGFGESPTPELFTRWIQAGAFYPFMRVHTAIDTADQEPWSFGVAYEGYNRRAIELRYELLPYIYTVMEEAATTGIPAMRPLVLEFPDDRNTYDLDDQFMVGRDLLVAPVLFEARNERSVYLPRGVWYDFWTGKRYDGGTTIRMPVTLESIPVFVREGGYVFRQPVVQHTGEMPGQPLRVFVYPAQGSTGSMYEDDGLSLSYRDGAYLRRTFTQSRDQAAGRIVVQVAAGEGSFRPQARSLELHVHPGGIVPRAVRLQVGGGPAQEVAMVPAADLATRAAGWSLTDTGFVVVKQPDSVQPMVVTIDGVPLPRVP